VRCRPLSILPSLRTTLVPLATGGVPTPPSNFAQPTSTNDRRLRSSVSTPLTLPSEPPPPKRRKLERPPLVETKRASLAGKIVQASTSSVSPVSSETLVGEHRVKKERSISPGSCPTGPRLITAGTKRYAPLPPECMKSQPNYKAARSAWAKKVQEELKRLGLKVVRTFIRFVVPHSALSCSHVVLIGKMVWQSIGKYSDDLPESSIELYFQGDYC
jgi:hypothetical protein